MQKLMDEARAHKCEPLMMIGDPEYYDRFFGFSAAATFGWECPGPVERHRLLAQSVDGRALPGPGKLGRSEEHTSELQSLMRISYAVFCLKYKITLLNTNFTSLSHHIS